ncbi:PAS domain-containing sensor histidine kinase [Domibacillus mangrovi]|uniref:PAS domain-containing sensor histidine kinase n=1 Tax=Domibacillus mangrovi TaxID=1714354 RepID=UPI000AD6EFB0|nr:PAS domain-containing sensor histidine kinase [Domibacillus mangrovi]
MYNSKLTDNDSIQWFSNEKDEIRLLIDKSGQIKYINPIMETVSQHTILDMLDQNLLDFIHPNDKEKTLQNLLHVQQPYSFISFIIRFLRKDGSYCKLQFASVELSERGWLQAIVHIADSEKEKHLQNDSIINVNHPLFTMSDSSAAIISLDGRVMAANQAFEKLYGWTLKEISDQFLPIVPEHLLNEFNELKERVTNGENVVHHPTFRLRKDGTLLPVTLSLSAVKDDTGKIKALSSVTNDRTEYLETQKIIEEQKELLITREKVMSYITENIKEVICLYDLNNKKLVYKSPSYDRFWGFNNEGICKDPMYWLDKLYPKDRDKLIEFHRSLDNSPKELEFEIKGDIGEEPRWIWSKITPIVDEKGTVIHHLCVSQDITDIKNRDNMLKKRDELGIIGQLAAGIAHEIRNPLTAVKGFIQLLHEETNNTYSDVILSELDRIEFIMNEFLMLAKPEQEMMMKKQNINDLLKEIIAFMTPEALLHQVEIKRDFDQEQLVVHCEPKQIKQVIMNLVKNAIEAMPSGGEVQIITKRREDGWIAIDVKDQGIGIRKDKQANLFKPFYSDKERGTGLGLMVSKKIIEQHKGKIHIFSEEGAGTLVQVLMPIENKE